jgi:hypothetical protein
MFRPAALTPLAAAAGLLLLAAGPAPAATSGHTPPYVPSHKRKVCPPYCSPCFGYYPTAWRPWPCPAPELMPPAGGNGSAAPGQPTPSTMPPADEGEGVVMPRGEQVQFPAGAGRRPGILSGLMSR